MKVTVPVRIGSSTTPFEKEGVLTELKKFGAHRIAFTLFDSADIPLAISQIKEVRPYFEENGVETCVWMGGSLMHFTYPGKNFTQRVSVDGEFAKIDGEVDTYRICPLDEDFLNHYCDLLVQILNCGVKMVFFDDDFRINFWVGSSFVGCFCPLHRAKQREILGEDVSLMVMREHILKGPPNKYRSAWRKANADSLVAFAKRLRAAADSVDKSIRLGLCSSHALWGTDAWIDDVVEALAGENKPLIRVWGGPYGTARLGYSIESTRFCSSMLEGKDWEIMSEGDVYPRPRYCMSASKLEGFDTAIRATLDNADILKYGMDYYARPNYETGYADFAQKNKALYPQIEKLFHGKTPVGYNMAIYPNRIDEWTFEEDYSHRIEHVMHMPALYMLCDNAIAGVYNKGVGASVVFGQNARFIDEEILSRGVVLDLPAAKILTERGIDVGLIEDKGRLKKEYYVYEWYLDEDSPVWLPSWGAAWGYNHIEVSSKAKVRSKVLVAGKEYVGTYTYENADGYKFFVFPFDADCNMDAISVFRTYARQRQLISTYQWLTGTPLDAVCTGHPDLYMVVRKGEDSLSVGLWNFSDDRIDEPLVQLGEAYGEVATVIGGSAKLTGKEVRLSVLYPYEFIGFEIKK